MSSRSVWAPKLAQQVEALTAKPRDPSLIPETHMLESIL